MLVKRKIALLYLFLIVANLGAAAWALLAFGSNPVLQGTAFLAYGFGLRHAVDADHIAAIDSVTRKMMQQGKRPLAIGFFFSLGHSTVVVAASIAVAVTTSLYQRHAGDFRLLGGAVGTLISAGFLLSMAAANWMVFRSVWGSFQQRRAGTEAAANAYEPSATAGGGLLTRLLGRLFGVISCSWHMYPLGILFGLGFDTATEIGLLGISAAEGARGLSIGAMLIFPALFTVAMTLVDTSDGILMVKAYGWAFASPFRRIYYNLAVTLLSALVALAIGGFELLNLIGDRLAPDGGFWDSLRSAGDHLGTIGLGVVAMFLSLWGVAVLINRLKVFGGLDASAAS